MTRIILRGGLAAEAPPDLVLAAKEPAVEADTGKLKIGDGVTTWAALPYHGGDAVGPHAATHTLGGGDAVTVDASQVTSGVLATARLPASVDPLAQHFIRLAAPTGVAATDTANLVAAIAAADVVNGTILSRLGTYHLNADVQIPGSVNLWGLGNGEPQDYGTRFLCTTAGSRLSFGTRTTGGRGGISQNFTVDGGGIATNALFVGLTVQRTFIAVEVTNAVGGWRLEGTQNSVFLGCNASHCSGVGMVIDYGAANNLFSRCEFDTNGVPLEVRQTDQSNGNTHGNAFDKCIFERCTGSGVRQYGGDWTHYRACVFQHQTGSSTYEMYRNDAGVSDLQSCYFSGEGFGVGVVCAAGIVVFEGMGTLNALTVGYRVNTGGRLNRGPSARETGVTTFADGTLGALGVFSERLANGQVDAGAANSRGESTGAGLGDKIALYGGGYGFGVQAGRLVVFVGSQAGLGVREAAAGPAAASSGADAVVLSSLGNVWMKPSDVEPDAPATGYTLYTYSGALKAVRPDGTRTTLIPA